MGIEVRVVMDLVRKEDLAQVCEVVEILSALPPMEKTPHAKRYFPDAIPNLRVISISGLEPNCLSYSVSDKQVIDPLFGRTVDLSYGVYTYREVMETMKPKSE